MVKKELISPDLTVEKKLLQENCGLVIVSNPRGRARNIQTALAAACGVQHRGQLGVGLAFTRQEETVTFRSEGLINEVFGSGKNFAGSPRQFTLADHADTVMIHTRYGTDGGYQNYNLQPCEGITPAGDRVLVIHNGNLVATEVLRRNLDQSLPEDASDTAVFTQYLAEIEGGSWDEKVLKAVGSIDGAFCFGITVDEAAYLARDRHGIRPFFLGRLGEGWIAASETHALNKAGVTQFREINRGEIIRLDQNGLQVLQPGLSGEGHFCDFELAYFSRPDSGVVKDGEVGMSFYKFRERCGELLAGQGKQPALDMVIGVPDSGVPFAVGYAAAGNVPYRQLIIRDHYDKNGGKRLFQQDFDMPAIGSKVVGKLSVVADADMWKGMRVGIGDDSIVRGNVSREITRALRDLGAGEVHWLIGFPKVIHGCHLGVSMRSREELIAARHGADEKKIAGEIGADSVNYISFENFVLARRGKDMLIPRDRRDIFLVNGGCGGCLTGRYPVDKEGVVYDAGAV